MRWLRERPTTWDELDSVDYKGRWIGGGPGMKEEEDVKGEKGRLFDDDDELKEEDGAEEEEEEEEEEKPKPQADVPVAGQQRRAPPMPPSKGGKVKAEKSERKAGGSR